MTLKTCLILALLLLTGCVTGLLDNTPQKGVQIIAPKGTTQAQLVLDARSCTTYQYAAGNRFLDYEFYEACLIKKGYSKQ